MPEFQEGSWVEWEYATGVGHGKVTEVATSGSLSVSGGSRNASEDEPAYKLRHWDEDEWGNQVVKSESELTAWDDPPSDTPMMDAASELSQEAFLRRVDASEDVFQTREGAMERAADIGCESVHEHTHESGTVFMPCASMERYEEMADSGVNDPMRAMLGDMEMEAMSVSDIEVSIPDSAQSAAQAYRDARDTDLVPTSCGTGKGTRIAGDIADDAVSIQQIRQDIAPYLTSHEDDTTTDTHPSNWSMDSDVADSHWMDCGDAQYAAWGWHSLRSYAQRKANQHAAVVGDDLPYENQPVGDAALPFVDATTVMDTITYEGVMTGELDESEIPNDNFQPHYVFDGNTKSESSYPLVDGDGMLRRRNVELAFNMRGQTGEGDDTAFLLDVLGEVNDEFDSPPIDDDDMMAAVEETDGAHMEEEDAYHMEKDTHTAEKRAGGMADGFVDTVPQTFTAGGQTLTDGSVDWDSVPTETLPDAPHATAFGTEQFYVIDATVAKPMDQQYEIGGEMFTFRKTADELQAATWQLDNAPWTLGHPQANEVTDADQIHGFFSDPEYVTGEGLTATLYVPTTDDAAKATLTGTEAVSIGFTPEIDYQVSDPTIDGVQRDLVIDHVASVEQGRCGVDDGCGIQFGDDTATVAVADCTSCSHGDCSCGWHTSETMSNDTDGPFGLTDMAADALIDRHDGVREQVDEYEATIEELRAERNDLQERVATLTDALGDTLADEFNDKVSRLDALTDSEYDTTSLREAWTDSDTVSDKQSLLGDVDDRLEVAEMATDSATDTDAQDTSTTPVADSATDGGERGDDETVASTFAVTTHDFSTHSA